MPFTFSHPAIIIPFQNVIKSKLSVTGLIVGSIIPDFEFFLKMRTGENMGHHWYGFFLFDIPVAILTCIVFHALLRDTIINNLPNYFFNRLNRFKGFDWLAFAKNNRRVVLLSIIIGILSHVFLDSFTHEDGLFVDNLYYAGISIKILNTDLPFYMILQILGSIIGLVAINKFIKFLPIKLKHPRESTDLTFVLATSGLVIGIFVTRLLIMPQYLQFWDIFMALMDSIIYSLIITSLYQKITSTANWQVQ